jgi:opacity protein-like surface antigen
MLKKLLIVVALFSLFSAGSAIANVDAGFNVDWNKPQGLDNSDLGVGARVDFGGQLRGMFAFDYFFTNAEDLFGPGEVSSNDFDLKFWELNFNLLYQFPTESVHPYLGVGAGIGRRTFDDIDNIFDDKRTEFGLNVLGGLKFGGWQRKTIHRSTLHLLSGQR